MMYVYFITGKNYCGKNKGKNRDNQESILDFYDIKINIEDISKICYKVIII